MAVWTWLISTAMSRVWEESRDDYGMKLARQYDRSETQQEVAEVLAAVGDSHGLTLPKTDHALLAALMRTATKVPVETAPPGAVLETTYGAVAYHLGVGALEPLGDSVTLVNWTPSRYVRAWLIPGVAYFHEEYRK
jgi:hypothetical protein